MLSRHSRFFTFALLACTPPQTHTTAVEPAVPASSSVLKPECSVSSDCGSHRVCDAAHRCKPGEPRAVITARKAPAATDGRCQSSLDCAAGQLCSAVRQTCVAAPATDRAQEDRAALTAFPTAVSLGKKGDIAQMRVILVRDEQTSTERLEAIASAGMRVACREGDFKPSCTFELSKYQSMGGRFRSTGQLWVKRESEGATQEYVDVASEKTTPQRIHVPVVGGAAPSNLAGTYAGEVSIHGHSLPVTATVQADRRILIYDPTLVLSSNGYLPVSVNANLNTWVTPFNLPGSPKPSRGSVTAKIRLHELTQQGDELRGSLAVTFSMGERSFHMGTEQLWQVFLSRTSDAVPTCLGDSACGAGSYCETSVQMCARSERVNASVKGEFGHGPYSWVAERVLSYANTAIRKQPLVPRAQDYFGRTVAATTTVQVNRNGIDSVESYLKRLPPHVQIGSRTTPLSNGCRTKKRLWPRALSFESLREVYASQIIERDHSNNCVVAGDASRNAWRDLTYPCVDLPRNTSSLAPLACERLYRARWLPYTDKVPKDWTADGYSMFLRECSDADLSLFVGEAEVSEPDQRELPIRMCAGVRATIDPITTQSRPADEVFCSSKDAPPDFRSVIDNASGLQRCCQKSAGGCTYLPPADVPLLTRRADEKTGTAATSVAADCLAELSKHASDPGVPNSLRTTGSTCIDVERLYAELALTGDGMLAGAQVPREVLRRLTEVLGFVANESALTSRLNSVADAATLTEEIDRLDSLTSILGSHWQLFFDGSANKSLNCGGSCPDLARFLGSWTVNAPKGRERFASLPTAIFDNLGSYARLVELSAQLEGELNYQNCPANTGNAHKYAPAIRTMLVLDALADRLGTDAERYPPGLWNNQTFIEAFPLPAPWTDAFHGSRAEFRRRLGLALAKVTNLSTCRNPLGIEESDLPLYFSDPSPVGDRFFASSDYLAKLAVTQIARAAAARSETRAAFNSARSSIFQEALTTQDKERRFEALANAAGEKITDLCGLEQTSASAYADFKAGKINLSTCHIYDLPECKDVPLQQDCFRGIIGEAAIGVVAADSDVSLAQRRWFDSHRAYNIRQSHCRGVIRNIKAQGIIRAQHAEQMLALADEKQVLDTLSIVFDSMTQCASGAAASFGAVCGTATASAVTKSLSIDKTKNMEAAERAHQNSLAELDGEQEAAACLAEADISYLEIKAAHDTIDRRGIDLTSSYARLLNLQSQLASAVLSAHETEDREKERATPSVAHHFWYAEHEQTYEYELDRAKKLAFMALRATEYEMQASFALRSKFAAAHDPDVIQKALDELDEHRVTRALNGKLPEATVEVLSVRDDILRLRWNPNTGQPMGQNDVNFKLRDLLLSPEAAYFDRNGNYIGQGVEIAVTPDMLPSRQCAQRLWTLHASLVGALSINTANLQIYKRDVFSSEWCNPQAHAGEPMQIGRRRNATSLFSKPAGSESSLSGASIKAKVDIPRVSFQEESGEAGASKELAGRGLFGTYIILLPSRDLLEKPGFDIQKLEDIWLRFNFVRITQEL